MSERHLTKAEKYEAFRNYMFNELGITKEDIRAMIRDAVKEQVKLLINQTFGEFELKQMAKGEMVKRVDLLMGPRQYDSSGKMFEKIAAEVGKKFFEQGMKNMIQEDTENENW